MKCQGKERFKTFHMAERVSKLSARRHEKLRRHAYRCDECGGYHVGSSMGPKERRPMLPYPSLDEEYA